MKRLKRQMERWPLSVRLTTPQRRKLEQLAQALDVSLSDAVRWLIENVESAKGRDDERQNA